MATRRLKIDLGDGAVAHAEVEHERRVGGLGGSSDGADEDPAGSLQGMIDTISGLARAAAAARSDLGDAAPSGLEIGFLAKFASDGALVITRSGSESHFHVKVRFAGDDSDD